MRSGIESILSTVRIKWVVESQREIGCVALWRLSLLFTTSGADKVAGLVRGREMLAPKIEGDPLGVGRQGIASSLSGGSPTSMADSRELSEPL